MDASFGEPLAASKGNLSYTGKMISVLTLTVCWRSTVDAVFFAYVLRSYSRTNKYTAAILAYVLGAGVFTVAAAPNFARLFKRQQEDEGACPNLDT